MTAFPSWAGDLICECPCPACQRPLFMPLPEILQAQPIGCACGHRFRLPVPPGLQEIAALFASLEHAAGDAPAIRSEWRRIVRVS